MHLAEEVVHLLEDGLLSKVQYDLALPLEAVNDVFIEETRQTTENEQNTENRFREVGKSRRAGKKSRGVQPRNS